MKKEKAAKLHFSSLPFQDNSTKRGGRRTEKQRQQQNLSHHFRSTWSSSRLLPPGRQSSLRCAFCYLSPKSFPFPSLLAFVLLSSADYSTTRLNSSSPTSDNLVPIRLDIEIDGQRFKDAFTWNPAGEYVWIFLPFLRETHRNLRILSWWQFVTLKSWFTWICNSVGVSSVFLHWRLICKN